MTDTILSGRLRYGQVGPFITGAPGNVLTMQADGITTQFDPPAAPAPSTTGLWVDAAAAAGGNGSDDAPFRTITEAVAAAPAESGSAIYVLCGDYSGETQVTIADKCIAFFGQGGAATAAGSASPPARPILPDLLFDTSIDPIEFYASNCELGTCEVNTPVRATLQNCSSIWDDTGGDATIRASGFPETFVGTAQQTIEGTCGRAELEGLFVPELTATVSIVSARGRLGADGAGFTAPSVVMYDHEFDAAAPVTATDIFIDQWTWFQVQELAAVLSSTPSVQELSSFTQLFGASTITHNQFLNPNILFGTTAATAATDWMAVERTSLAERIRGQLAVAEAFDVTFTLFVGATPAAVAATALAVTVPAGQLTATAELAHPVLVPGGRFAAARITTSTNADPVGPAECIITYN